LVRPRVDVLPEDARPPAVLGRVVRPLVEVRGAGRPPVDAFFAVEDFAVEDLAAVLPAPLLDGFRAPVPFAPLADPER
jgi:hypothetical protein